MPFWPLCFDSLKGLGGMLLTLNLSKQISTKWSITFSNVFSHLFNFSGMDMQQRAAIHWTYHEENENIYLHVATESLKISWISDVSCHHSSLHTWSWSWFFKRSVSVSEAAHRLLETILESMMHVSPLSITGGTSAVGVQSRISVHSSLSTPPVCVGKQRPRASLRYTAASATGQHL